jgi:hypothetical protein
VNTYKCILEQLNAFIKVLDKRMKANYRQALKRATKAYNLNVRENTNTTNFYFNLEWL